MTFLPLMLFALGLVGYLLDLDHAVSDRRKRNQTRKSRR